MKTKQKLKMMKAIEQRNQQRIRAFTVRARKSLSRSQPEKPEDNRAKPRKPE